MLGVDIGGTGVRAARVRDGEIVSEVVRVALARRTVAEVVDAVAELHGKLGGSRVGVGVPGFVRPDGVVLGSPNFPGWEGVALAERLRQRLGRPVVVVNDANAAAVGVWRSRGGTEAMILLTLGTGVGGGVVLDGSPLLGRAGTAGELGHTYVGGDRRCGCGGIGCLEMSAGTVGWIAGAAERGVRVTRGSEVLEAAERGETWATEVLKEAASGLGRGLVSLTNTFAPDAIVIGGGLTVARPWLEPAIDWLRNHAVPPSVEAVEIAWLGPVDTAAIVGAADLASR